MEFIEVLGLAAAGCTTVSFVPQVVKVWRTRSARDISTAMFLIFSFGVLLWLIYGIAIVSWPLIIANAVTLCLTVTVLYFKFRYG